MKLRVRPAHHVHSISTVPTAAGEDRDLRMRNYLLSMGIRTFCFVFAGFFIFAVPWTPGAWICLIAAVVLPYPAVIFANATSNQKSHFAQPVTPVREIGTHEDQERSPGPGESW